jgi:guanine nucleotide-binding protein subunit alpha
MHHVAENSSISLTPRSLSYFFSSIDRLFDPSYVPNEQDIMRHSVRTTGISEMKFNINGYDVTVVDVGGQRSERRKWIHVMQDVTSILFSVNLNGYDQNLVEHENQVIIACSTRTRVTFIPSSQNEMEDAMLLWASICRSERFKNCSIVSSSDDFPVSHFLTISI